MSRSDIIEEQRAAGLCECGCGQTTAIAKRNHPSGVRKGQHMRFIASHSGRARTALAADPVKRFWSKVEKTPRGCWIWTGQRNREGYGRFAHGSRTTRVHVVQAHRYAYELVHGPITNDLHLDHLCRVTRCVNPDHLEPVTPQVNVLRGIGPAAINAARTHCPQGHAYDGQNTRLYSRPTSRESSSPGRYCRQCEKDRNLTDQPHPRDRTHCSQGHDLSVESPNVRVTKTKSGIRRVCRECARQNTARYRATR